MTDNSQDIQIDDCWNRIGVWRRGDDVCPLLQDVIHCRNCHVYSNAGRRILRREMSHDYREEWTHIYAEEKKPRPDDIESVIIFRLGDEWLAIASRVINEVTDAKKILRLPHTRRDVVKGLVNIRGELELCVGLGGLLGLEKGGQPQRTGTVGANDRMLHIASEGNRYVFPVTEVHGIQHFSSEDIHPVPATVSRAKASYTRSMLHWNDRHVGILDDELLFYTLNKSLK